MDPTLFNQGFAARAFGIGIVAGLRSQVPFAVLANVRGECGTTLSGPSARIGMPWVRTAFIVSAVGELIGDKLPVVPSRLAPLPLAGRIVFGAAAGAVMARSADQAIVPSGVFGGIGAIVGAYTGYTSRATLTRATRIPDVVWALAEDVTAVALATAIVRIVAPNGAARCGPIRP